MTYKKFYDRLFAPLAKRIGLPAGPHLRDHQLLRPKLIADYKLAKAGPLPEGLA